MSKGKTSRFNTDWLSREEYKDWLPPEESDNSKARCKIFKKTFYLSNMGETAVKSHAEGKKHASSVKVSWRTESVSDFFMKIEVQRSAVLRKVGGLDFSRKTEWESSLLTKLALRKEQCKSEILWAVKSVILHFSYSSICDIVDVFKAMFPDSKIAQGMSCGPTKLSYLITFGIAPYFKQLLVEDLKKAPCFVVLFDKSLNTELHQEQMDFTVRYFKNDQVIIRYLSSAFLGYTTTEDLKLKFEEAIQNLDTKRMVQVSVDGPNVNWKMLSKLLKNEVHLNITLDW